jgi:hypothetical protein
MQKLSTFMSGIKTFLSRPTLRDRVIKDIYYVRVFAYVQNISEPRADGKSGHENSRQPSYRHIIITRGKLELFVSRPWRIARCFKIRSTSFGLAADSFLIGLDRLGNGGARRSGDSSSTTAVSHQYLLGRILVFLGMKVLPSGFNW